MIWRNGAYVIRPNPNYPNPDYLNPTIQVYDPSYPLDDEDPMVISQQPNRQQIEAFRDNQAMAAAQKASQAAAELQMIAPSPASDAAVRASLAVQDAIGRGASPAAVAVAVSDAQKAVATASTSAAVPPGSAVEVRAAQLANTAVQALDAAASAPPAGTNPILNYGLTPVPVSVTAAPTPSPVTYLLPPQTGSVPAQSGADTNSLLMLGIGLAVLYYLWKS